MLNKWNLPVHVFLLNGNTMFSCSKRQAVSALHTKPFKMAFQFCIKGWHMLVKSHQTEVKPIE